MDMNLEKLKKVFDKKILDEIFENRPNKDQWENCLLELIIERNKILSGEHDKKLIDEIDKVIEGIQEYLSVATK